MGAYIALQPEYNMAHWTPNQTMRDLGLPYAFILGYEHYLPWVLHFFIGMILTLLLYFSKLFYSQDAKKRIISVFILMVSLIIIAEWVQSLVGRNVQLSDLVIGLAGISIATVFLASSKKLKNTP